MMLSPTFLVAAAEMLIYIWGIWRLWSTRLDRKTGWLAAGLFLTFLGGRALTLLQISTEQNELAAYSEAYLAFASAIWLWLLLRAFQKRSLLIGSLTALPWVLLVILLWTLEPRFPEIIWEKGEHLLPRQALPALGAFGGWIFLGISMVVFALREARNTHQPMYRIRFAYWVIILLLFSLDGLTTFVWALPTIHPLRAGMAWTLIYLLTHLRVQALHKILRVGLIYFFAILLTVLLYITSTIVAQRFFSSSTDYDPLWNGSLIALGLAILFAPLLNQIQKVINRWLRVENLPASQIVQLYSQNISHILETSRLAQVTVALIIEAAGLQHGFLFLVDKIENAGQPSRYRLRAVRHPAERQIKVLELSEDHPIVSFLRQGKPLLQYELDLQPDFRLSLFEREWFNALRSEVYVPIFSKGNWIGLFAFGARINGQPFSAEDLALLTALAQQTGVALENARLVEDLVQINRELRKATRALQQAQQEIERLDRTRSDFISIASHELRTPLTVIRGYVEMLLEREDIDPNMRAFLKGMHESTMRMHNILESMFAIAQLSHHPSPLETEMVNISALIQETAEQLVSRLIQRSQTLQVELPPLPFIPGDKALLSKAFFQLLENGIKFTPDRGKLRVEARLNRPDNTWPYGNIELIFSDTGVGVDPSQREAIFTKFYQSGDVERHSTSKVRFMGGGTGLGLAFCKAVVEAHQGRIWVESPGYDEVNFPGSQFHVALPLRPPAEGHTIRMSSAVKRKYP